MTPQQTILLLRSLEAELLDPNVRKSDRVEELLHPGFIEFGSSGHVWSRTDTLQRLREEFPLQLQASDFLVRLLSPDCALVLYRATHVVPPHAVSLRSSLWQRTNENWQLTFHQGTPLPLQS